MEQRADLGARPLVHDPATQLVRNLFVIHDELCKRGWAGVEALLLSLVGRALTEAEILYVQEPSPVLMTIIETLRSIKISAEARAAQALKDTLDKEWGARAAGASACLRDQLRRIRADGAQLGRQLCRVKLDLSERPWPRAMARPGGRLFPALAPGDRKCPSSLNSLTKGEDGW